MLIVFNWHLIDDKHWSSIVENINVQTEAKVGFQCTDFQPVNYEITL